MSEPATRDDLKELEHKIENLELGIRNFVLERETSLIWKVIALQVTLIGALSAGQWAVLTFVMQHWKP